MYINPAAVICLRLLTHARSLLFCLARPSAGNNNPARIAMIAMTTSNSISVKPFCPGCFMNDLILRRPLTGHLPYTPLYGQESQIFFDSEREYARFYTAESSRSRRL